MVGSKQLTFCLLCASALVPLAVGCSVNPAPKPAEALKASETLGGQAGSIVIALVRVADDEAKLQIDDAREITCLRPENDAPQTNTRWIIQASGPIANAASGNEALDRIAKKLKTLEWAKDNEVRDPHAGSRKLSFNKGQLMATTEITDAVPHRSLEIFIRSRCADQPVEHRMQRSELDPDYGKNSQYYDDWK